MSLTVGILGGGQLARMMVLAGAPLGLRFELYDPAADACSGPLAPLTVGAFDQPALRDVVDLADPAVRKPVQSRGEVADHGHVTAGHALAGTVGATRHVQPHAIGLEAPAIVVLM